MNRYNKSYGESLPYSFTDSNSYTYVDGLGFTPPPPVVTEHRLLQWYSNGIGFAILFTILFSFFMPYVVFDIVKIFSPAIQPYNTNIISSPILMQCVDIISSTLSLLLPFVLFGFICKISVSKALSLRRFNCSIVVPAVLIAMGVSVIGAFASQLFAFFLSLVGFAPTEINITIPYTPAASILYLLNLTVFSPIIEEVVFRGIVLNTLRRFGDSFALFISSLFFALIHMHLLQIPNAFLMGLVIGYFVLYSGSLWTGILIHVINNSLVVLLNGILYSIPTSKHTIILLVTFSLYLAGGIIAMLYLVRKHSNMFVLLNPSSLSIERKKYFVFFSAITMIICLIVLGIFTLNNTNVI